MRFVPWSCLTEAQKNARVYRAAMSGMAIFVALLFWGLQQPIPAQAQEAPLGLEGSSELAEKIDGEEYGFPGYDLVLAGGDQDCLTTTVGDLRGRGHARVSPQALAAWHDARGGLRYSIQNLAYCMTGSALVQPFTVEITYNNTTEAVLAKLPHPFFVIDPARIPSGSIEVREDCKPDGRYWSEVWIPVKKKEK